MAKIVEREINNADEHKDESTKRVARKWRRSMLIERIKSCVALSSEYEEESLHYSAQFTVCSTNDGGFGDTFGRHLATLDSGPRLMLDDSRSARAKVK